MATALVERVCDDLVALYGMDSMIARHAAQWAVGNICLVLMRCGPRLLLRERCRRAAQIFPVWQDSSARPMNVCFRHSDAVRNLQTDSI